ncbi:hypothetical protein V8F33_010483 [Rhypophila sp. PSN 637]
MEVMVRFNSLLPNPTSFHVSQETAINFLTSMIILPTMSYETSELRCACSASFDTKGDLNNHLQDYRSIEQHLRFVSEICRTHCRVGVDGDRSDDTETDGLATIRATTTEGSCPHPECEGLEKTWPMKGLVRHFWQHVSCLEVCVECHKVFRHASGFLRHSRAHPDLSERKRNFINATCEELRSRSSTELTHALEKGQLVETRSKKRKLEEAHLDSVAPITRRGRVKGRQQPGWRTFSEWQTSTFGIFRKF